jgi:hypothetical protein
MARILNLEAYPFAETISDLSYLVGTDATDNKETKNFKIEDLKTHILPDPLTPGTFENATVVVGSDGQISSVTQGASGSSKWSFSPNADDIYRNSNVGIGDFSAADPAEALEVQGNIQVTGATAMFIGDINGAVLQKVKVKEAGGVSKGDVVYISGGTGDNPEVMKARANSASTMAALGIMKETAAFDATAECITSGELTGINLTGFATGDDLYVSSSVAGELVNTAPTGEANLIQKIGKVIKGGNGGALTVLGAFRSNATPNLNQGSLFIGDASNQSSTLAIGGANTFLKSDGTTASWAALTSTDDLQDILDNGSTATGLSTLVQISTSNQLDFTSTDGGTNFAYLRTVNNNDLTLSAANGSLGGEISLNPTLSYFKYNNASGDQQVSFNGTAMTVTDAINTKGLEYAADYSANFTARSLVDKAYVDSNVPSNVALVGTYTNGFVPRWNATTNTLALSNIKDDGTTISISSNTANIPDSATDLSVTAGLDKRAIKVNQVWGPNEAAKITVSRTDLGTSPTTAPVTGLVIDATSGKGAAGDFRHIKLDTELSITPSVTPKTISNVFGIQLSDYSAVSSVTANNLYQIYLGDIDALTKGSGEFYGIYQKEASIKNYFGGQLQLNHTSGTAGQFLKSADTAGNAVWSAISNSDVTGAVQISGTPVNNQIAVWTNSDTIEGTDLLTYNGGTTALKVSSPSDDDYSEMTNNGITQVRSTNDSNLNLICYGDQSKASEIQSFKYRNVFGTPQALLSGDLIASHRHIGYDGTAINTGLYSKTFAAENWTGSATGVYHVIDSCAIGETTATERFRIDSDGSTKITGQVYSAIQSTTYTPTGAFQVDLNLGNVFVVDLSSASGSIQIGFTNPKPGANYFIKIIQHPTAPVNLIWASAGTGATKWPGGTKPTISTGASAIDAVAMTCISTTELLCNFSQDYQA